MKHRVCLSILVLSFAFLAILAVPVDAQVATSFAQLNGTVRDASGAVVTRAAVALHEVDTNQTYSAVTNDAGFYALPNLSPGRYGLTVEFPGFAKYSQSGIVLRVGQTGTIDVALTLSTHGEEVNVTAEVPLIEPARTEISQRLEPPMCALAH